MKRESVDTPSILSPALTSPASPPPSDSPSPPGPKTKKRKSTSATKPAQANAASGEFTPDKKAHLMDLIITAGYKSLDMGEVAKEVSFRRHDKRLSLT